MRFSQGASLPFRLCFGGTAAKLGQTISDAPDTNSSPIFQERPLQTMVVAPKRATHSVDSSTKYSINLGHHRAVKITIGAMAIAIWSGAPAIPTFSTVSRTPAANRPQVSSLSARFWPTFILRLFPHRSVATFSSVRHLRPVIVPEPLALNFLQPNAEINRPRHGINRLRPPVGSLSWQSCFSSIFTLRT